VEKEKNMKLVLRILPTVFVLISSTAFADTVRENLGAVGFISPNFSAYGIPDNVSLNFTGPGVTFDALGNTPPGWFDYGAKHPGDSDLGPTTITWDGANLQIGSTDYASDQFKLNPTPLDVPRITLPPASTNGYIFSVTVPWTWKIDGTINTNCPSSGCDFMLVSAPVTLGFSYLFGGGIYVPRSEAFSTPEPGTLGLMAAGFVGLAVLGLRRRSRAMLPA
jgi:hypothetical protein